MDPFAKVVGTAVPYLADDVNTDEITPVHRDLHPNFAALLFARRRRRADGSLDPEFPLNQPQFAGASVLVVGKNFGCGSSRESAVWAMLAVGIKVIVARSFADIYRDNCLKNGLLPVVFDGDDAVRFERDVTASNASAPVSVDLVSQTITGPSTATYRFEIAAAERTALLEGLDDIGLSLRESDAIAEFEKQAAIAAPWNATLRTPA